MPGKLQPEKRNKEVKDRSEKEPLLPTKRSHYKTDEQSPGGWFNVCASGVSQLLAILIVLFALGVLASRTFGRKSVVRGPNLIGDYSNGEVSIPAARPSLSPVSQQVESSGQVPQKVEIVPQLTPARPSQAPQTWATPALPSQAPPEVQLPEHLLSKPIIEASRNNDHFLSEPVKHQNVPAKQSAISVQSGDLQATVNIHDAPSWESLGKLGVQGLPLFVLHTRSGRISSTECTSRSTANAVTDTKGHAGSTRVRLSCPHGVEAAFEIRAPMVGAEGYLRLGVDLWPAEYDRSLRENRWPSDGFQSIRLFEARGPTVVRLTGPAQLPGLPLTVADEYFIGGEHPLAISSAFSDNLGPLDSRIYSTQDQPASQVIVEIGHLHTMTKPSAESPWRFGAVVGIIPEPSQARRAFVNYLHHERPGRRTPMVHYNSWFDFYSWQDEGFFGERANRTDVMNEASCIGRVRQFGEHLVKERGVKVDSFLFDDGWDDTNTLWEFDRERFPRGFKEVARTAHSYESGIGVWLSPWGGYGDSKSRRVSQGRQHGFEITSKGAFDLMGPKYSAWFDTVITRMRHNEGVNLFKFDGVSDDAGEMEAMLGMITRVRKTDVDKSEAATSDGDQKDEDEIWINLTTGTWASPFFLLWADSIWRGDGDVGPYPNDEEDDGLSQRQKWIRWRAGKVQEHISSKSAFFPLSQLMIHGVVLARHGDALYAQLGPHANAQEFAQEVWSFVGLGLQLQEMYVSAKHMTPDNWDALAEGLTWARANADILMDAHWAFGEVTSKQVFCVASWHPEKGRGFVLLQNTQAADQPSEPFTLAGVLQLPDAQQDAKLQVKTVKSVPGINMGLNAGSSRERLKNCQGIGVSGSGPGDCLISAAASTSALLHHTEVLILEVKLAA